MKALYGARKAEICSMKVGDMVEVPSDTVEHYRSAAAKLGLKIRIVRHYQGRTIIQITNRSSYGVVKSQISKMSIGESMLVPAAERTKWTSAAQRLSLSFRSKAEGKDQVRLTLCVRQKRQDIQGMLRGMALGSTLRAQKNRALSYCVIAYRCGVRLSRAKISTGEYILTRAA
jgi:hypothetical protein